MNELLSVSPMTMGEDEQTIGRSYKKHGGMIATIAVLGAVAYCSDLKYLILTGFVIILWAILFIEARLYDLCIRLKRSNHLQYDGAVELLGVVKKMDTRLFQIVNSLDLETKSKEATDARGHELREKLLALARAAATSKTASEG